MPSFKLVVLVSLLGLSLTGCGGPKKYVLQSSGDAVGADARLVADINKDTGTTKVDFEATNLPPPGRVEANAQQYEVWQRGTDATGWTRIGTLDYDETSRKGTLKEVSVPMANFDFQVTAEAPGATSPSNAVVFVQRVSQ